MDEIVLFLFRAIVFLFRAGVQLIKARRSNAWPVAKGRVAKVYPPELWPCPKVEIVYTYTVGDRLYTGMCIRAFCLMSSAQDYANQFMPTRSVLVRYRLGEPTASVARLDD